MRVECAILPIKDVKAHDESWIRWPNQYGRAGAVEKCCLHTQEKVRRAAEPLQSRNTPCRIQRFDAGCSSQAMLVLLLVFLGIFQPSLACSRRNGLSSYQSVEITHMMSTMSNALRDAPLPTSLALFQSSTGAPITTVPTSARSLGSKTQAMHRRMVYDFSNSTNATTSNSSTPSSTSAATATPSACTLPHPFDTTLGDNFTTTSCPAFMNHMLNSSAFISCYPISLLLQASMATTFAGYIQC